MLMPPFELHRPATIDEACQMAAKFLESGQEFDWIAGGTDLILITNGISTQSHM